MRRATAALVAVVAAGPLLAHAQGHGAADERPVRPPETIRGPAGPYSLTPTPAFDAEGRLWVAFGEGAAVYVSSSLDKGRTFTRTVRVTRVPEKIDANGENRPKVVVGPKGRLHVTWTQKLEKPYTGLIRYSRSTDGGRTFTPPVTLNDDGLVTGHRFDVLGVAPGGDVVVAWVDKRDLEKATSQGGTYEGAAIYFARSRDGGRSFGPNVKVKDHACECCRLALAFDAAGSPVLLWRDILAGGIRDHSLAHLADPPGPVARATFEDWKINGCPHHGPSLSIAGGIQHMAWFSGDGREGGGLYYGRSTDGGRTFAEPARLGSVETSSHPSVLGLGSQVFVAWKESKEAGPAILVARSADGGQSFGPPAPVLSTRHSSDHPLLASDGKDAFLSWFTTDEGYRLVSLTAPAAP